MSYNDLSNLPVINGQEVIGDKMWEDYGMVPLSTEETEEIILEIYGYVL